jgi:hypothetical protein
MPHHGGPNTSLSPYPPNTHMRHKLTWKDMSFNPHLVEVYVFIDILAFGPFHDKFYLITHYHKSFGLATSIFLFIHVWIIWFQHLKIFKYYLYPSMWSFVTTYNPFGVTPPLISFSHWFSFNFVKDFSIFLCFKSTFRFHFDDPNHHG